LFRIVDVEYSWICLLKGKPDFQGRFEDFRTLEKVWDLSDSFRIEVEAFLQTRSDDMENRKLRLSREGHVDAFPCSEVLRHVITREIHHIGQLSVWARELNRCRPI